MGWHTSYSYIFFSHILINNSISANCHISCHVHVS